MAADQEKVQALLDKIHKAGERTDVELYRIKFSYEATIATLVFVTDLIPPVKDAETISPECKLRASQTMVNTVCNYYNTDIDNLDDVIKTEIDRSTNIINQINEELNEPNRKYSGLYPYIVNLLDDYGLLDTADVEKTAEILLTITNTDFTPAKVDELPTQYKKIPKINDGYTVLDQVNDELAKLPIFANELNEEEDDEIREKIKAVLYRRVIYTAVENWVAADAKKITTDKYIQPKFNILPKSQISNYLIPGLITKPTVVTLNKKDKLTAKVSANIFPGAENNFSVAGFNEVFGKAVKSAFYAIAEENRYFSIAEVCRMMKGDDTGKDVGQKLYKTVGAYLMAGANQLIVIDDTDAYIADQKRKGRKFKEGEKITHVVTERLFNITPALEIKVDKDGQHENIPQFKIIRRDNGSYDPPEMEFLKSTGRPKFKRQPREYYKICATNADAVAAAEDAAKKAKRQKQQFAPVPKLIKYNDQPISLTEDRITIVYYLIDRINDITYDHNEYLTAVKKEKEKAKRENREPIFIDKNNFLHPSIKLETLFEKANIAGETKQKRAREFIRDNVIPSLKADGFLFDCKWRKTNKKYSAIEILFDDHNE